MFEGIYTMTFLLAVFAFSEIVAEKTKALLSTTLVIALTLMFSFWLGLPKDIFVSSSVDKTGMILVSLLITSMGSNLDLAMLKKQWKTLLISVFGVSLAVGLMLLVLPNFIGRELTLAGAPIFAGGNAAALMMKEVFFKNGLEDLYKFSILMLVTQNFVGIPLASYLLRKEARLFLENRQDFSQEELVSKERPKPIQLPEIFNKPSVILTKLALVSILGHLVSRFTGGRVHPFISSLLLGVVFTELGFLEKDILQKTNSASFIIFTTTVVIFSNLADTSPREILSMIYPLALTFLVGIIGIILGGYLLSKILKTSPYMTISLALTCTFGFPTTMLMPQEIALAIGRNKEEKLAILDYILPQMLTAGFVTVTIFSVVLTGFLISFL